MMKNKVLIKAVFPAFDKTYDIKIPACEYIWKVNKLIVKAVYDMNGYILNPEEDFFVMVGKNNGKIYDGNTIVIDSDIRNGSEVIFLKEY